MMTALWYVVSAVSLKVITKCR